MPLVDISEIKPGMILNKDVEDEKTGTIFATTGTVLSNKIISRIRNLGTKYIHIIKVAEGPEDEQEKIVVEDSDLQIYHKEFSFKAKSLLNKVKLGKKLIITEISETMDNLIYEVTKSNNILGRLRQLSKDDDYTFEHSVSVSMLATMLGKWLNYSQIELKQLAYAGIFHDIGKLKIGQDIINKPGQLTKREFEIVKKHTIYGYNLLNETIGISKNVVLSALQHHEREDGSGYPQGLKSKKIHEFAQIIAVCDIFNTMTTDKSYRGKVSPFEAAEYIDRNSFRTLNPTISRVFLDRISGFYVGNKVELNTGESGVIIMINKNQPTRPVIRVNDNFIDLIKNKEIRITDVIS